MEKKFDVTPSSSPQDIIKAYLISLGIRNERAEILAPKLIEDEALTKEDVDKLTEPQLKDMGFKAAEINRMPKSGGTSSTDKSFDFYNLSEIIMCLFSFNCFCCFYVKFQPYS